ncbi:MAG: hypothetical protein A2Y12_04785 [Planctomycetes bacterium GWF2_42_9]|nr:MAG: hypothetical protein A2Y12_04785 [Planctomycetes bacterium GWF2_42_9]
MRAAILFLLCTCSVIYAVDLQAAVKFDKNGYMLVDGQPQFPVSIYVAFYPEWLDTDPNKIEANLNDMRNSPFDFMINYGSGKGSAEQIRRYYEQLKRYNLKEFFDLTKYYNEMDVAEWKMDFDGTDEEAISRTVKSLKDCTSLIGWYIFDENPKKPELVTRHYQLIKEIDPNHPAFVLSNEETAEEHREYLAGCDIFGVDCYPVAGKSMISVADRVDSMMEAVNHSRSAWFVTQTFGWYLYKNPGAREEGFRISPQAIANGTDRPPTPEEIRCMSYLAIVHGATGLSYYYHKDIMLSYDAPVRWAAVKAIAKDIKDISPILTAQTIKIDPKLLYKNRLSADNISVHWMAKKYQDRMYLILVNTSRDLQSSFFNRMPWKFTNANVIQGDCFAYGSDGLLLVILDGLETAVIELQQ